MKSCEMNLKSNNNNGIEAAEYDGKRMMKLLRTLSKQNDEVLEELKRIRKEMREERVRSE